MVFFFWKCLIQGNQTVRIFSLVSLVLACSFCRFLHRVDVTKAIFFLSLMQFTLYQHTLSLSVLYPLIHSSKVVDLTTIFLLLAHKLTSVDCSRKKNHIWYIFNPSIVQMQAATTFLYYYWIQYSSVLYYTSVNHLHHWSQSVLQWILFVVTPTVTIST